MKTFTKHDFNPTACQREIAEFKVLLDSKSVLSESKDILPFFRARPNLCAFMGTYAPYIEKFDRIAYEYQIFGDFACDLVIGDSTRAWYCFVEFENASPTSIFEKKPPKTTPEWATRFEHGFSQIVDWFWKLEDMKLTIDLQSRFDANFIRYQGLLVIGRDDSGMELRDTHRKSWRVDKVVIDSRSIICITFDQLYRDLNDRMEMYLALAASI